MLDMLRSLAPHCDGERLAAACPLCRGEGVWEYCRMSGVLHTEATPAQREAWLLAFPDEPARTLHPAAVALVEALAVEVPGAAGSWSLHTFGKDGTDRAFAAWLAAGRPVWVSK